VARQVVVLAGTNKGLFIFRSDVQRRSWRVSGPHMSGWEVFSVLCLPPRAAAGLRLLAGTSHAAYGPTIRLSDDLGATWTQMPASPRFTMESGLRLKRIWQLTPGAPDELETVYAGVEEAGLFVSHDRGESWLPVDGLNGQLRAGDRQTASSGRCLHSVLVAPTRSSRMWVGVSGAGVLRTDDGGEQWVTCNACLPAPEAVHAKTGTGQYVQKLALDPRDGRTLYLQHRCGVFKSIDGADSWQPTDQGLPGSFGFPVCVAHTGEVFVAPLAGEDERYMPDGRLRLYRSGDGGDTWAPCDNGLPAYPSYVSVLRDALAVDSLDPLGVYVGTTAGELFCSSDGGDTWQALPGQYSRITVVKAWANA